MPHIFRGRVRETRTRTVVVPKRAAPELRGYDWRWRRRSAAYRRRHPFCARCEEVGRLTLGDVVDHKYPVSDGGDVHCPDEGLWTLCAGCHGWKQRLEAYARATGQIDRIVMWCDQPETRPRFRGEVRYGSGEA